MSNPVYRYPLGPGECPDIKGRPIYPGDLVRIYHYTAALRRRRCYLYHVATLYKSENGMNGGIRMLPVHLLNPDTTDKGGEYFLSYDYVQDCHAEIISGLGPEHPFGPEYGLLSFHERKKIGPPLK